jgi:hypothetical protein
MTARRSTDVLTVVGFDPSLNNWGIARGTLTIANGGHLDIVALDVIQPVFSDSKQVRNNSKDLERAEQLARGAMAAAQGADAIFVEVPHGSQSARAMASYAICIGVLGALRAQGIPFFELSEGQVKTVALGKKGKTTKQEMIDWATRQHPTAPWPTYQQNGKTYKKGELDVGRAEHMSDAIGTIYAGLRDKLFQQMVGILQKKPL